MGEIISRFSLKSITSSVALPTHDPISFGFEEMVKAKADSAKLRQELAEIGKGQSGVPYRTSERSSGEVLTDKAHSEYIYDQNIVAELSEIKRKKNRR